MPFSCVEGWPKDPQSAPGTSLSTTPAVVWTTVAGSELVPQYRPGIALSGDNIILSAADFVTAVDRRTGVVAWRYQNLAPHQYFSPPVTDVAGNIYVTRDSAVEVLEPSGKARVLAGFEGTSGPDNTEFGVFSQEVILSPDGVLFHQSNDGTLRALRANDGTELWSVKKAPSRPSAGVAGVIVVGPDLRDAATGRILGQFTGLSGAQLSLNFDQGTAISYSGFLGTEYLDVTTPMVHLTGVTPCGMASWTSLSTGTYPMVDAIGPDGVVYVTGLVRDPNNAERPNLVSSIRSDGSKESHSLETVGRVVTIGADETMYVMDCSANSSRPTDVVALTPTFVEKWRLTVPGHCASTNVLLTDDGMLYFGRHTSPGATEIVAVQTRSPGLARSAWPTWRHDNRATAWLTP